LDIPCRFFAGSALGLGWRPGALGEAVIVGHKCGMRVGAASVAARGSQVGRRPSLSSFGHRWGGGLRRASGNGGGGGTLATSRGHARGRVGMEVSGGCGRGE